MSAYNSAIIAAMSTSGARGAPEPTRAVSSPRLRRVCAFLLADIEQDRCARRAAAVAGEVARRQVANARWWRPRRWALPVDVQTVGEALRRVPWQDDFSGFQEARFWRGRQRHLCVDLLARARLVPNGALAVPVADWADLRQACRLLRASRHASRRAAPCVPAGVAPARPSPGSL